MVNLIVASILAWILLYLLIFTVSLAWHSGVARFNRVHRLEEFLDLKARITRAQAEIREVLGEDKPETVH